METPAPNSLEVVLSAEWLSTALSTAFPGTVVASTTLTEQLDSVATKARFDVVYEERPDHRLPLALCVKGYFSSRGRERREMGLREARFYDEFASVIGTRSPRCFYSAIDPSTQSNLIIMEDLVAQGATFLTPLSPYSTEQTAATLDQIALLNASRWDDPATSSVPWLSSNIGRLATFLEVDHLQRLLDGERGEALPANMRDAAQLKRSVGALALRPEVAPRCVIHGDIHAGNLYLDAEGEPGLVDWQVIQWSTWALDVAVHIASVLDIETRRHNERELIEHYLASLEAHGVEVPSFEEAWHDYRLCLPYAYCMWAVATTPPAEVTNEFVTRLGTAVADHGSYQLLLG